MAIGTTLKISFDGTEVKRGLARMKSDMADLGRVGLKVGASIAAIGAGLAAAAAAFAVSSSKSAAGMEDLEVQFEVLTKSAETAKDLMAKFREEAVKSPLSVEDYAKAAKTLLAFGISSDRVLPILKNLGDVSMGNAERFGSLALAFAQTQAAGRLMGQEVLQFVNAGFNPLQEISRKTGRSMIELKKAMEDGAISSDMVTDAFKSATSSGGLFYKALERGSETTSGKIAKVKDSVQQLQVAFGTGLNGALRAGADIISEMIPKMIEPMENLGTRLGDALRASFAGNASDLINIGEAVGTLLGKAANLAFQNTLRMSGTGILKAWEDFNRITGVTQGIEALAGGSISGMAKQSSQELLRDDMRRLIDDFRVTLAQVSNPANNPNRIVRDGMALMPTNAPLGQGADLRLDGKHYQLLERIARNTESSPL